MTKITAIIAEDEALLANDLSQRLTAAWPELEIVALAKNGPEALTSIDELKPDVAFLDIQMPGMTGLEMLPKLKEMRPDVPIIMITAYGDPETRRKAMEGGATGLLTKPIDFTLLREEIDARLDEVN